MMTKSSARQTTQYNHFTRVRSRLADLYARVIAYQSTHAQCLELRVELFASDSWHRLTRYHRGYIMGQDNARMQDIWQRYIVYMLGPASGPTRIVGTEWTEEMSQLSQAPGALFGGHFWLDTNGQPTRHAFTPWTCSSNPTDGKD